MHVERIKYYLAKHDSNKEKYLAAKRYYKNENDIVDNGILSDKNRNTTTDELLRNADNRVPHIFHGLLTDEKASYMFTYAPIIDVDNNDNTNKEVQKILGNNFSKVLKNLCVEASNCGKAWLHYWVEEYSINEHKLENNTEKKYKFKFSKVDTEEIIPIYNNKLIKELDTVIRIYSVERFVNDFNNKKEKLQVIEIWDKQGFEFYTQDISNPNKINKETENKILHNFGEVPFIEFANNENKTSDLIKYKKQIDLYDKVMSGYANDIEDIQQIIYILENYGGEDLGEFKKDLKRYKTVNLDTTDSETRGDLRTLRIDIPVEARKVIVDILKKQIYEFGQGLQQDIESVGNASGVALKFFYRKLELKSGITESEFRESIEKLIKAICRFNNFPCEVVQQTFTRNMISNELENAQIAQQSVGIIPTKYILANHPWIDDVIEAEQELKKEQDEKEASIEDKYPIIDNVEENTND